MLNIIMYHYVRNNEDYFYDTFSRRKDEFEAQIDFFRRSSEIVDPADMEKIKYYLNNHNEEAYLLTFDDGYKDHFYCAKYLFDRNIRAFFFPPISSLNGEILDINSIHMIIGVRGLKIKKILKVISEICLSSNFLLTLNKQKVDINTYLENFKIVDNYDDRNTLMIKRILQKDIIGDDNRKFIIDILIKKFIGEKSSKISSELYLNIDDLQKMKNMGMLFGSHGKTHRWLTNLNYFEQKEEIEKSLKTLKELQLIGSDEPMSMCYPFGAYDSNTIKLMGDLKIDLGFTTDIGASMATNKKEFIFKLPRWDTNHFWDNKWRRPCVFVK